MSNLGRNSLTASQVTAKLDGEYNSLYRADVWWFFLWKTCRIGYYQTAPKREIYHTKLNEIYLPPCHKTNQYAATPCPLEIHAFYCYPKLPDWSSKVMHWTHDNSSHIDPWMYCVKHSWKSMPYIHNFNRQHTYISASKDCLWYNMVLHFSNEQL